MPKLKILGVQLERRKLQSEEALMLAVLEQAVVDLGNTCPAVRADAEAYFFAYEPDSSAFSFDAICSQFAFSPSAIRQQLRKRLPRPQTALDRAA